MKKELKDKLIPVFNANPTMEATHLCEDGQSFTSYHDACLHQREVLDVKFLNEGQFPEKITRDAVFADDKKEAEAKAKAEAEAKAKAEAEAKAKEDKVVKGKTK